jgi:hypothetical protein
MALVREPELELELEQLTLGQAQWRLGWEWQLVVVLPVVEGSVRSS